MRNLTKSALAVLALASAAMSATAQEDLLAGKPIHTLGDAKTWTAGDASYTFITEDLAKLVATPTNTDNVYLYPENGTLNTPENQALGMQAFYVDMQASHEVSIVNTTWEGAAASAYNIYLTDEEPTLDILNTTPVYTASGLGQYKANTAQLPESSKGRYLVFQGTDATNWGWGVKMHSISAYAPVNVELTTFTALPGIVLLGEATQMTLTFKDQLGVDIAADAVTITVSDNATFTDGKLTVSSGAEATIYAAMGDKTLEAKVCVASAPALPDAADIKTPVFTNTLTDANATAKWEVAYNGGAVNAGVVTFSNGEIAQEFLNTRCVFFSNSETTGEWNGAHINAVENGYRHLHLEIFSTKDCEGKIMYEGQTPDVPFTLEAKKWNVIETVIKDYTDILLFSIRFDEANMTDILLTNIYFTHLTAPGDTEAPVFAEGESGAKIVGKTTTTFTLQLLANDAASGYIDYRIEVSDGVSRAATTHQVSAKSGEAVTYTVDGLEKSKDYTVNVYASDGTNETAEPVMLNVRTNTTGVEDVTVEGVESIVNVYNVQGALVRGNVAAGEATLGLAPGIYIVAGGNKVEKVLVR